jgi:hypothetical protein
MKNKSLVILSLVLLFSGVSLKQLQAQVTVEKSGWADALSAKYDLFSKTVEEVPGYRIQIMYANNRDETNLAKANFYQLFPAIRAYVIYEQPYYKLRVGDFKNKLQLTKGMSLIAPIYSGCFTVKDDVKIK